MAEIIKKGSNLIMKFHAHLKRYNRVEKFVYRGVHFNLLINRNDSVYDIIRSVKSDSGFSNNRDRLFDSVVGNPTEIAKRKIMDEIDVELFK